MLYIILLPFIIAGIVMTTVTRMSWIVTESAGNKAEAEKKHMIYGAYKISTQILIIVLGIVCFFSTQTNSYAYSVLIISGLAVSLLGDLALYNIKSDRTFIFGLFIFLIAICLYAIALTAGPGIKIQDIIPGGILLVVYIFLLVYFIPDLKREFTIPITVYGLVWCYLISRSFTLFYNGSFSIIQAILVSSGTISFFCGDLRLAIWKLKDQRLSLSSEPATYAIGQTCIALSLAFFPT